MPINFGTKDTSTAGVDREALVEQESIEIYDSLETPKVVTSEIEGEPITVRYFENLATDDTTTVPYDPQLVDNLQQYRYIKNFRLAMEGDFESIFTELGESSGTVGFNIYPNTLVPKNGDMVVCGLAGRIAIFTLTNITKASSIGDSYWQSVGVFYSSSSDDVAGILSRSVERVVFDYNAYQDGLKSFLTASDVQTTSIVENGKRLLLSDIYRKYYDPKVETLVYEFEGVKAYDGFAIDFLNGILTYDERKHLKRLKEYNISGDIQTRGFTLWDALLKRDTYILITASQDWQHRFLQDRTHFLQTLTAYSAGIVYALEPLEDLLTGLPYLFSEAFWNGTKDDMTGYEVTVYDVIDGKRLAVDELEMFVNHALNSTGGDGLRLRILAIALIKYWERGV